MNNTSIHPTGFWTRGLKVTIGDLKINVPDFTLQADEIAHLSASSGFGKTSVIRAIAGLLPHEGSFGIGEIVLSELPVHQRNLGVVFQDQNLLPHLNAVENVALGLRFKGKSKATALEIATESLRSLGMEALSHQRLDQLSGGERQRLALLRVLILRPRMLLMDEPDQGLDQDTRAKMSLYLNSILAEHPIPVIVVSHHLQNSDITLLGEQNGSERNFIIRRKSESISGTEAH